MVLKILKNPITLFISMLLGILAGLYMTWLVPILSIFNDIYLSLLQVCIIPIVASAIIINIGLLFQKQFLSLVKKWIISIFVAMIFASTLGIGLTFCTRDFISPTAEVKSSLSTMNSSEEKTKITDTFNELSLYGENHIEETKPFSLTDFITDAIPSNIFTALTENRIIQIVIFSSIIGIILAFIDKRHSETLINVATGFYTALCKFIDYMLILLPLALFSILAVQFSNKEIISLLSSLAKYIWINYIAIFILIALFLVLIQISAKCSLKEHLRAIKRTFFIAISTSSCIASTPILIEDIPEPMGLDKKSVQSIGPVSIILCQTGTILAVSILAIYATLIYDININLNTIFIILVGSIVFSISVIGVPGVLSTAMLSIILQPIGIPTEVITTIFLSTISFYQGASVFASLYGNIALISFILPHNERKNQSSITSYSDTSKKILK